MSLRAIKNGVARGELVIDQGVKVTARTEFQQKRLTAAVSAAQIYLSRGLKVEDIAGALRVTSERAAQIVRLGVKTMQQIGMLRPADNSGTRTASSPESRRP